MTSGYEKTGLLVAWPENGSAWIEQELCIEPHQLPVSFSLIEAAADEDGEDTEWTVSITDNAVTLKRDTSNVAYMPRRIPLEDFTDVVLWGALASNEGGDVMVGLSLYSEEHDLQVPVCISDDTEGMAARWIEWSHAMELPPKVLNEAQKLRDPFRDTGDLSNATALPRRMPAHRLDRGTPANSNVLQMHALGKRSDTVQPQPH